jgi:REP element-mobilizing transposase RayT
MKRKTYSEELNFVTVTVVDWIDVFTRRIYSDFVIECLKFCHQEKGMEIYAYVLLTNHLHMVVRSFEDTLPDILRDFKTYTSKELFKMIASNPYESRKVWMLKAFEIAGLENPVNKNQQFWQNGNQPIALFSNKVIQQKVDYIHQNPVKAGFVDEASKYFYSSANPFNPLGILI